MCAIFEVKQRITSQLIYDAGRKVASVRSLRRTSIPIISGGGARRAIAPHRILAGILAVRSPWNESFQEKIADVMRDLPPEELLDFGCALQQGSFECKPRPRARGVAVHFSTRDEARIFFIIRLMVRLRALGTAPRRRHDAYGRAPESLSSFRDAA